MLVPGWRAARKKQQAVALRSSKIRNGRTPPLLLIFRWGCYFVGLKKASAHIK